MTWSYDDPSTIPKDTVRLKTGDTDEDAIRTNTDEEIVYFLADRNGSVVAASVDAAIALQAKYSSLADQKTGDIQVKYSDIAARFAKLAMGLKSESAGGAMPYAGGIDVADAQSNREDDSVVQPAFDVGFMDHPEGANPKIDEID